MGRYLGSSCKHCRREGMKLMLKGSRCETGKCAVEKRERHMAPGMHGWRRGRHSDYGVRLREKQKVKRYYGLGEKQFMLYFDKAERVKGNTGIVLLEFLERRLDNTMFRLGFANSRDQARQVVRHNHVLINGKKVNIPSFFVSVGDVITLKEKSKKNQAINESLDAVARRGIPSWLELDRDNLQGSVKSMPERHEITMPIQEQLIVELYSK